MLFRSLVLFISIGLFGCNHYEEKDKIVIRGSTSVEPIMEILMDDYLKTVEGEKTQFDIKCEGSGKEEKRLKMILMEM